MKHPIQPVVLVGESDGKIARFQQNKIVRWLCDSGRLNLNEIAIMPFDDDDRMQIAMLLGYSVSGFGDLSYADPVIVSEADQEVEKLLGGT
ncbi:MAG: hypothetical protein ACLPTZ_06345 [Beijerinckiaceae bacterium]